jgi:hypothetical protein
MKCKGQVSRSGRLAAFYDSREFLTDAELRHVQPSSTRSTRKESTCRSRGRDPPRRQKEYTSDSNLKSRGKKRSRRKTSNSEHVVKQSSPYYQGMQTLDFAIDVVISAFDTCGAYELSYHQPSYKYQNRADRKSHNHKPRYRKSQCETRAESESKRDLEDRLLERTLHLRAPSVRNGEDSTLVSALTDIHI